jgi:hypothetical protein
VVVIVPDTKNWTWVVDQACPECRFDASGCRASGVAGLVRQNAQAWTDLLAAGVIRRGRPDQATWSTLEYACHVRDVYRRYLARIDLMLGEADPLFENWDQDATAVEDAYDDQDPEVVVAELLEAAAALAARLDVVSSAEWTRPGSRSDGATFTVDGIARYMVHDTIHHVWDVSGRP